jgi:2-polyprenyl-3-methyl-5-hydroxy-6-metoxy-1,4-benzoquinol methylase
MKSILKDLYHQIYPSYLHALTKAVGDCETLLDVGCGAYSPLQSLRRKPYCTGVDAFEPSIKASRSKGIHDEYRQLNILELENNFEENSYDCVLLNDVIEHLEKEDGLKLIRMLEKIAKKHVIIFTPNGFVPQEPFEGNPWQEHKSGWSVKEMQDHGYKVWGINGWKYLMEKRCEIKFRPRQFWLIVTSLMQFFTYYFPNQAFQIFCVKEVKSSNVR